MSPRSLPFRGKPFRVARSSLLALSVVFAAGCSSSGGNSEQTATTVSPTVAPPTTSTPAPSPSQATGELSGTWSGKYSGAFNGTFTLKWTQTGPALKGTIDLSTAGALNLSGVVSGNTITFGTVGSTAITYTGTVSGDSMSGTYQVAGSGGGNWSATKTA